jgi:hypothetical protein
MANGHKNGHKMATKWQMDTKCSFYQKQKNNINISFQETEVNHAVGSNPNIETLNQEYL